MSTHSLRLSVMGITQGFVRLSHFLDSIASMRHESGAPMGAPEGLLEAV